MGHHYYNSHENKVFAARYDEFFENSLTLQEASGNDVVAGDGVASIKRRHRDQSSDGIWILATVSGRGQLKKDLESSTWRQHKDSDDGEVLNELIEYENFGMLRREKAINTYNTVVRDIYMFVGSFTYITDFVVLEDIGEFIQINKAEVVMGKPFRKITKLEYDYAKGLMSFNMIFDNYTFQMPRTIPRLYLIRRSLEVLRKFHWMILGGRFNQLSYVSSPLLSKTGKLQDILRVTAAQLQLLSDYNCWKEYADRDEIKD
ncbi:hypothetical protein Tco_1337390 [Tanacetum coccineum]